MCRTSSSQLSLLLSVLWVVHSAVPLTIEPLSRINVLDATNKLDWKCQSDEECIAKDSKCIELQCQCSTGYIFSTDMTSCLKVATKLADQCTEDIQCSRYLLTGGRCVNNACTCAKGYYYMHGRCNPHSELLGKCQKSEECYVTADLEASVCSDGICRCSPGYYQREYRTCRRSSKELGDICLVNADCQFVDEKAYCNDQLTCAKEAANLQLETSFVDVSSTKEENEDIDGLLVGDKCDKDQDCESLGAAVCSSDGTCACKRAHFASKANDQCVPELGEPCKRGDAKVIKNSICRNSRWACEGNVVASSERQKCRKASRRVGESCQEDEQCQSSLGPDGYCDSLKCACNGNSHYVESEEFCWTKRAYGDACQLDFDCYVDGFNGTLFCTNNRCSCPNGTRLHTNGLKCVTSSADIGMACDADSDCVVENALCVNDVCACPDNYYEMDGKCFPGINATCSSDEDCTPENSVCLSEKCDCQEKFVASSSSNCLSVVEYGKPCIEDVQCEATTANSNCILGQNPDEDQKLCRCMDGYYFKADECFRKRVLGETCGSRDDCYLVSDMELAICLNGFCACNWGYAPANLTLCTKTRDIRPFDNSAVGPLADGSFRMLGFILPVIASIFARRLL